MFIHVYIVFTFENDQKCKLNFETMAIKGLVVLHLRWSFYIDNFLLHVNTVSKIKALRDFIAIKIELLKYAPQI